jgi:serine/threonine protein kinase
VSPFAYATQPNDDVSAASISLPATTPHVDSYKISKLDEARQRIKQSFSSQFSSPLLSNSDTVEYIFPRFDKSELILGNVLGCGGFGTVLEIRAIRLLSSEGGGGFEGDDEDGAGREIGEGFDAIARNKNCSNDNDSDINRQDGGRRTFKTMCPNFFHWRHAKEEQHEEERGDFVFTGEGGEGEGKNNYGNNSDDDAVKGRRRGEEGAPPIEDEQQQQRQVGDKQIRKRQVSRNFSIQAWRDSDPGEEGNDAISQEEMKRYKSEYSSSRGGTTEHSGVSSTGEDGDGDFNLAHCLGDVCPGATLSTVLEKSERASQFSIYETTVVVGHTTKTNGDGGANVCDDDADEGGSHQHQQHQQRRRIVFFKPEDKLDHDIIQQDKQYISENATTREGESRYAIKIIQPDIVQSDFKKFLQAAMDMATETYFLSVLRHPHILKMRAVGQGDMFSPDYFLVLDRLYDTLLDRIEGSWTETANHLEKDFFVWSRTKKVKLFWAERVGVMRDIAAALAYMHDLRIIYRDIVSFCIL